MAKKVSLKKSSLGIKIPVVDEQAQIRGEKAVKREIFGLDDKALLVAQALRVFLSNQRKARAKAKTRSLVAGSGAKIWRQKGTGRARHGDRKAPIFVGGGIAHGPTGEQNYKRRMSRQMAKKAYFSILSDKLRQKGIFLVEELKFTKTKEAGSFVEKAQKNLDLKKGKIGFLVSDDKELKRCLRNLRGIFILDSRAVNPYSLLKTDFLFVTDKALRDLEARVPKINWGGKFCKAKFTPPNSPCSPDLIGVRPKGHTPLESPIFGSGEYAVQYKPKIKQEKKDVKES